MDHRYIFLKILLAFELLYFFLLVFLIFLHIFISHFKPKILPPKQDVLLLYFINLIGRKEPFELSQYPVKFLPDKHLIETLEALELQYKEDLHWQQMKQNVVQMLLLPKARKWAKSCFVKKKNLAGRIFTLCPLKKDEKMIVKLLDSAHFLVRNVAIQPTLQLASIEGIRKLLLAITDEQGFSCFFYRDMFAKNANEKVLSNLLKIDGDPKLHIACLQILAICKYQKSIPFLLEDLKSNDPIIRNLALQVLIKNPSPEAEELLKEALHDPDKEVRKTALIGLETYTPSLELLEKALQDASVAIRINAAKALKKRGEQGLQILQRYLKGPQQEVIEYVMQFDHGAA